MRDGQCLGFRGGWYRAGRLGVLVIGLALGLWAMAVGADAGGRGEGPAWRNGPGIWLAADHTESDIPFVKKVRAPDSGQLILVRHADRDPSETDLNVLGRSRAAKLPEVLADLPLDAIFMTGFRRNADSAAPLARTRGLTPQVLEDNAELARALADAAAGGSAIWIGNVGNLSHLWDAYRLPGRGPVEYGDIAVLTAERGVWQVEWRRVDP